MSTVQDIKQAVSQLAPKDLARFRRWFNEFDAKTWDKQFEQDVRSGKLDRLAKEASADYQAGKYKEL